MKEIFASHGIPDIIVSDNGSPILCSDISPVCNELCMVCACDEFSAIRSIERRSRTDCAYHEGSIEEERSSTHRSHGLHIDAASVVDDSSKKAHELTIANSMHYPSSQVLWNQRVPTASLWKGRKICAMYMRLTNATTWRSSLDQSQNRQGQYVVNRTPEPRSYLVRTDLGIVLCNRRALVPTSRDCDDSNGWWTPPTRVSTTSDIATPTVEMQLPTTPARSSSRPTIKSRRRIWICSAPMHLASEGVNAFDKFIIKLYSSCYYPTYHRRAI